jgi:hypothetical protein
VRDSDTASLFWIRLQRRLSAIVTVFLSRYAVVKKVSPEKIRGKVVKYSPSTGLSVPAYGELRSGNWRAASSKNVKAVNQQLLPPLNRIRWTRSWYSFTAFDAVLLGDHNYVPYSYFNTFECSALLNGCFRRNDCSSEHPKFARRIARCVVTKWSHSR